MLKERSNHTLQPTALVHEALMRILGFRVIEIQNVEHLFSLAVGQMRQVLASYARRKIAQKRGGTLRFSSDDVQDPDSIGIAQIIVVD